MFLKSVFALLLVMNSLCIRAQTNGVTPTTLTLHHIGPFTGQLASSNAESVNGAEIYFDLINAKGGVNGRKILLAKIDDKQDPKESTRIVQDLINRNELLSVFMPRTTPSTIAIMSITEAAGVPMVGVQTGAIAVSVPFRSSVFTMRASYQDEVVSVIKLLHETGSTRFGFLVASDAFGKDVMAGVERALKELKLSAVSVQSVDQQTPEVSVAVDNMIKAGPDTIVLIAGLKGAADFVTQYRKKGGFAKFATLSNNGADSFVTALGDYKRGVIVTSVVPSPNRRTSQLVREYVQVMEGVKKSPSFVSLYGYVVAKVVTEGLRRAGRNLTPESLNEALNTLGKYDLGNYVVEFNNSQHQGSKFVEASIIAGDGKKMN